jgi:hypothetical protein
LYIEKEIKLFIVELSVACLLGTINIILSITLSNQFCTDHVSNLGLCISASHDFLKLPVPSPVENTSLSEVKSRSALREIAHLYRIRRLIPILAKAHQKSYPRAADSSPRPHCLYFKDPVKYYYADHSGRAV